MPTPTKPAKVIELEKKSHRTKAELRKRKKAEADLLTGKSLKETKEVSENQAAHQEFLRIKRLLKSIGKDDDLYSGAINRYCILKAECEEFERERDQVQETIQKLEEHTEEISYTDMVKLKITLSKQIVAFDRQIQAKRKMMFDHERENVMTIASSLRSIPKKQEAKKNALREALGG